MAHSVLKEIAGNSLVAPGIGAGVNADIYLSNVADCAVDLVIAKGKGHFVAHLIGQLPLQGHRLPLGRLMGEAVQLLLIHRSEDGRDSLPGQGQLCAEFVLNFHRHAGGGGKVVRDVSGLQRHRLGAAGKGQGQPLGDPPVILAGAQPAGDVALVPVRQQMRGQHFPEIIVDAVHVGGEILDNAVIPGVQVQQPLKVFLALGTE